MGAIAGTARLYDETPALGIALTLALSQRERAGVRGKALAQI